MLASRVGAKPHDLNVTRYDKYTIFGSIELGGSAGKLIDPSRATQILVFGMFGLATCLYLPKKVPQGGSKADKVENFE